MGGRKCIRARDRQGTVIMRGGRAESEGKGDREWIIHEYTETNPPIHDGGLDGGERGERETTGIGGSFRNVMGERDYRRGEDSYK